MLPERFLAIYEAECGDQIEMWNCKVPRVFFPCDDCNEAHYYYSTKIVHYSWSWDKIVEDESL